MATLNLTASLPTEVCPALVMVRAIPFLPRLHTGSHRDAGKGIRGCYETASRLARV